MAMDKNIKARWVAKLREEGRQQTQGALRRPIGGTDKYAQCCLDVLCEVAVEDGVINPPEFDEQSQTYRYSYNDDGYGPYIETAVLPTPVCEWAGVGDDPFIRDGKGASDQASYLNDEYEFTFAQIADAIEADEEL